MAQNKAQLKSRIKSITATKKITGAMEMIANAKLQKERGLMFKNREYSEELNATVSEIVNSDSEIKNIYLEEKSASSRLFFVYCSDLGLCGGYNVNVTKLVSATINKEEDFLVVIGRNQYNWFKTNGYKLVNEDVLNTDQMTYNDLKKYVQIALKMFVNDEIGSVNTIYTKYVNNVTFEPNILQVLPFAKGEQVESNSYRETLFEPNADAILNSLIPMTAMNMLYTCWLQSKTSEQGSRRFAMENATDNANDLTEKLVLQFNQARQAAITQEIAEIVGGAEAL